MADARRTRSSFDPLPYYKWLVTDYRASRRVQRLPWELRGLLRELLDEQWIEGALRDDVNYLAEVCGCPVGVMAEAWKTLKDFFPPIDGMDGVFLQNRKLESVRSAQDRIRAERRMAGAKGGLAKAKNENGGKGLVASAGNSQQVPYSSTEQSKAVAGGGRGAAPLRRAAPAECPRCGGVGAHTPDCVIGRFENGGPDDGQ